MACPVGLRGKLNVGGRNVDPAQTVTDCLDGAIGVRLRFAKGLCRSLDRRVNVPSRGPRLRDAISVADLTRTDIRYAEVRRQIFHGPRPDQIVEFAARKYL
jgi:hypothetical protein